MTRSKIFLLLTLLLLILVWNHYRQDPIERYARQLQEMISGKNISAEMSRFAERPHRAGTEQNGLVGEAILDALRRSNASVWTTEYGVDLPTQVNAQLEMTFPVQQKIPFAEKSFNEDPYSSIAEQETPFFAYVPNADVEGEVIYANFGDRQDYDYLKKKGIAVAGKIALVRAQGICRGMKQQVAEEEGLAALLIYPDVKDQGFVKAPYPSGPGINPFVVQRGSMLKFFLYPGDPWKTNPDRKENTLPTVPALPISAEAARRIFERLQGEIHPEWGGGMHFEYHVGPGPIRIKLTLQNSKHSGKIRNIFASLGGEDSSAPVILISCHYDAWIYGASDPSSGTAVVLEAAKALFKLEKKGWKPKRDIVFAFWDAEEYGMIGSTQWVLQHIKEVRSKVAAVLYVDSVRGPLFGANIAPGLRGALDQVIRNFADPNTGKTITDLHLEYGMPGFSDDTIPFTNLAGLPVAQMNYGTNLTMYHSVYDNLAWMSRYCDPEYKYTANLARVVALFTILLSKDSRLPFQFSEFGAHYEKQFAKMNLERDFSSLQKQAKQISDLGNEIEKFNFSQLTENHRKETNDLLLKAILTFTEPPDGTSLPFGSRNVWMGPSPQNECAGVELSGIQRAKGNEAQLQKEMERAMQAFTRSKELLSEALTVLRQSR